MVDGILQFAKKSGKGYDYWTTYFSASGTVIYDSSWVGFESL